MFIRRTRTNNTATGEDYFTFRLVRGERIAGKMRQITILNLGRHFPVSQDDWPLLCSRIEQLLVPQAQMCVIECPASIERTGQRYYAKLVGRADINVPAAPSGTDGTSAPDSDAVAMLAQDGVTTTHNNHKPPGLLAASGASAPGDLQFIDVDSLELSQPRSVGVEHVALHAIAQLGLVDKLTKLGLNALRRACILGNLIGRMVESASDRSTWQSLGTHSALGELLDVDFEGLSHMSLYRASDSLMKYQQCLEDHIFNRVTDLFALQETVTLYDLTNTYFEGQLDTNPKVQFGRSKEKRTDCPLVTLALVLDGSGFVRRSKTFDGNVSEGLTLELMLKSLQANAGSLVIMDAGIATQANIDWLIEHKYRYLAVRRGGVRAFDAPGCALTKTIGGETVRLQKVLSEDGKELELHCHSQGREQKVRAMLKRFCDAFEARLQKIADGLNSDKPRSEKGLAKLQERIGRLKQKSSGVSRHYQITLTVDESEKKATALSWSKVLVEGTMATHPGVCCLRTNELSWDEQTLWQTYVTLTDIESVFRSLKSELGLHPVFHHKEGRCDGHLFITALAYQCVQVIRKKLKELGINENWATLRKTLQVQQRVTVSMRRSDKRTVHMRKSTKAEPRLLQIYQALGLDALAGGTKKLVV